MRERVRLASTPAWTRAARWTADAHTDAKVVGWCGRKGCKDVRKHTANNEKATSSQTQEPRAMSDLTDDTEKENERSTKPAL